MSEPVKDKVTVIEPPGTIKQIVDELDIKKILPPTASPFTVKQNDRATVYARKFTTRDDIPKPTSAPKYTNDLFQKINIEGNIHVDDGPENISIDVQPDYRNIFLALNYHVSKIYQDINIKDNPLVTPASLMAYMLSIVYGHALISEVQNIRNQRSDYANEFTSVDLRRDLLQILENAPVPDFLQEIIHSLMPTSDPRRPGIQFTHSLACFLMQYDFGRTYPITMFMAAHNLIASRPANQDPNLTLAEWYDKVLFQTHQGNNVVTHLRIRNLIGTRTQHGTYYSTIVNGMVTLFNPVTQRTNTARPTFSRLTTYPIESDINNDINPYIYLLGADDNNIQTTLNFMSSMSNVIGKEIACTKVLGSSFDLQSGVSLIVHHYARMSFPTWYPAQEAAIDEELTAPRYAASVGFMQPRVDPVNRVQIPYPAPANIAEIAPELYNVNPLNHVYAPEEDPDHVVTFDRKHHLTPDVMFFDPWDFTPSAFAKNIVNGIHIETDRIIGFAVPQPRVSAGIINENMHFLNSAIPARYIKPAMTITAANPLISYRTKYYHDTNQPVSLHLGSLHQNRMPQFDRTVCEPQGTPLALYGFHPTPHIGRLNRMSNRLTFRHGTVDLPETSSNFSNEYLNAWSSYRYLNNRVPRNTEKLNKINFILNFRTLYGTNVTMAQSKNPFLLIPTA